MKDMMERYGVDFQIYDIGSHLDAVLSCRDYSLTVVGGGHLDLTVVDYRILLDYIVA